MEMAENNANNDLAEILRAIQSEDPHAEPELSTPEGALIWSEYRATAIRLRLASAEADFLRERCGQLLRPNTVREYTP